MGLRGLSRLIGSLCVFFKSGLSTTIRVSLIVAPNSSPRGFGRVDGFGQRVFLRFPLCRDQSMPRARQTRLGAGLADVTTRQSR